LKPGLTVAVVPAIGPAVVTLWGHDIPVMSMVLSFSGLMLARLLSPPRVPKLRRTQEVALTGLLLLILFVIISGSLLPDNKPLEPGWAVLWAIGLGFSGLAAVEFINDRIRGMMGVLFSDRRDQ
jgi:peptidoglycan/LPS O-acetylase OafA/YrhL